MVGFNSCRFAIGIVSFHILKKEISRLNIQKHVHLQFCKTLTICVFFCVAEEESGQSLHATGPHLYFQFITTVYVLLMIAVFGFLTLICNGIIPLYTGVFKYRSNECCVHSIWNNFITFRTHIVNVFQCVVAYNFLFADIWTTQLVEQQKAFFSVFCRLEITSQQQNHAHN